MRFKNNQGFEIESETIKSNDLQQVRKLLPSIMETNADIIVVATQQATGKSYASMGYMAKNPNSIFLTGRHNLLDELERYFNNHTLENSHWYGIQNSKSPCLHKNDKIFKDLLGLGYKASFLCKEVFKCETCPYKAQFKNKERILAPLPYLNTAYLTNEDDSARFETYLIDESITSIKEFPYNIDYLLDVINPLFFFAPPYFFDSLKEILMNEDLNSLESRKDEISFIVNDSLKTIHDLIGEDESLETEIWRKDIEQLSEFNIDDIITSLKYKKMYNDEIDAWHKPAVYKIFDLAQKSKIVLLHATFDLDLFTDLISSYSAEVGIDKKIKVKVFYSKLSNKSTKVYDINPGAYYPDFSLQRGGLNEIRDHIEVITSILGNDNVGVLSFNKYNSKGDYIPETFSTTGLPSLHYGNVTGLNTLEDKQCLIIAGHYQHGNVIGVYNQFYLDSLTRDSCKSLNVPHGTPFTFCPETHPKLSLMQKILNEFEMKDGFHRSRSLIHDNRIIIAFCSIPPQIYDEFDVVNDKRIELTDWKDLLKEPETPIYELVRDYLENSDKTDSEIAEELNIVKDESYDVELVKRMRRHYEEAKEFGI